MATTKNITMKQFNGTDYDTLYPKTVYNQVSGVAPAGYGLGGIGKRVTDMNNAQESGFYSALGASNLPPNVESVQYGSVLVLCSQADRVTQIYFQDVTDGTGAIAVRRLNGNGWSQWEFINPPMKLGIEYRTAERYLGKPVYAKAVSGGAITPNSKKAISMSTVGESIVDTCVAAKLSNGTEIRLPYTDSSGGTSGEVFSSVQSGIVSVAFTLHGINATESTVIAKYTKTTD